MYVASIVLLVCSGVLYQLFQKLISPAVNPALSLICSYTVAILVSSILFIFIPLKGSIGSEIKNINIYSFMLAIPIIGIELGYLLLYRAGGKFSYSSSLVSAMIMIILVLLGMLLFKEKISIKKILGIVLCMSGIVLLNVK
jgi:drug/metabolite transporter (DMT)-like permease